MSDDFILIGLSGKAGSGKDTAAKMLCEAYGLHQLSLAEPLKRYAAKIFRFDHETLWGPSYLRNHEYEVGPDYWDAVCWRDHTYRHKWLEYVWSQASPTLQDQQNINWAMDKWLNTFTEAKPAAISPRTVLQSLGTEVGRQVDEYIWITRTLRQIGAARMLNLPGVVVSDVRFKNEMKQLQNVEGKVIRLHRPDEQDSDSHKSETEQNSIPDTDFDAVINNTFDLAWLSTQLLQVVGR